MKVTAKELQEYFDTYPEDDWYGEDCEGDFDEVRKLAVRAPETLVEMSDFDGVWVWQGTGKDPTSGDGISIVKDFKRWRKTRTHQLFCVSVPKQDVETFTQLMKNCAWKVEGK